MRCIAPSFVFFAVMLAGLTTQTASAVNILFYGNSYTLPRTVDGIDFPGVEEFVKGVAFIAGHPNPNTVSAAFGGRDFEWHLDNNTDVISTSLPVGQQWDYVVLQNQSVRPTTSHPSGDLSGHRASALALYQEVAAHSAGVVPVMFETWAREPGNSNQDEFYPPGQAYFAGGPTHMQNELRLGYQLAGQDIDATVGSSITRIALVGDAWEDLGFAGNLYAPDGTHPNARGRLLTGLTIYSTIYGDDTHDLLVSGALNGLLTALGMDAADGDALTLASDHAAGLASGVVGDFDNSGSLDATDIEWLFDQVNTGNGLPSFDVNGSGTVDLDDIDAFLSLAQTSRGDTDLDGDIDLEDAAALQQNYKSGTTWSSGDFDGDGDVDFQDAMTLRRNYTGVPSALIVPEPGSCTAMGLLACMASRLRRFC